LAAAAIAAGRGGRKPGAPVLGLRAGVGGCRAPAAPAMPCVADWLNNPFSIVQGIFGERGPGSSRRC